MIWVENLTSTVSRAIFMETTETKPLTKHIGAAVTAIQKEIDKRTNQVYAHMAKIKVHEDAAEALRESISGLQEQISKLKGE